MSRIETQIREDGPNTDPCGTCPDNHYVERLVFTGFF